MLSNVLGSKDTAVNKMSQVLASWSLHFFMVVTDTRFVYWIKLKKHTHKSKQIKEERCSAVRRGVLATVEWSGERKLCQCTGEGQLRGAKVLRPQLAWLWGARRLDEQVGTGVVREPLGVGVRTALGSGQWQQAEFTQSEREDAKGFEEQGRDPILLWRTPRTAGLGTGRKGPRGGGCTA